MKGGISVYLPESTNGFDWVWIGIGSPWGLLAIWLVLVNLAAFVVFGWDKFKAKYREKHPAARRVPERTLFLLALLGGSVGALLGMRVWRHKTLHRSFRIGTPLILAAQVLLGIGLWLYLRGV